MKLGRQMPLVSTPAVRVKTATAQRCEQRFPCQQCLILAPTEARRYYPARLLIQRLPQAARLFFAADKGPPLVQFRLLHPVNPHLGFGFLTNSHKGGVHRLELRRFLLRVVITVVGLTPSTRAVSRIPLPFSVRSIICCFTGGMSPLPLS